MKTTTLVGLLIGGSMIAMAGQAAAQTAATTSTTTPDTAATTNDTPSTGQQSQADTATGTAPVADANEQASQAEFLQAQLESLQTQVEALKKQMANVTPTWKGAPQFGDAATGFTFKPKGFFQFDAGYVGIPGPTYNGIVGGLNYNNLGWNLRARRIVVGAEGTMPGGFGYKVELNLAQGTVDYEDIVLTYQRKNSPWQVTVGNFYPLSSLETMTSSRLTSFLERASFTDAFNYNRRLGAAVGYASLDDMLTLTAGIWGQEINNANFQRTGWQASVRGTYSPTFGSTRVHVGANYQHRVNAQDGQLVQYRSRPLTQLTDQRLIDTGAIASNGDDIVGVELAAIHGPLHVVGEAQKVWVDGFRPGKTFGANNAALGATFYNGDPDFFSAYGEAGFYLTGETRGYKGGKWDRTKVLHPFDQGGIGAIQINGRVDYVDLSNRVASGEGIVPNYVNGGKMTGYELSVIWNPMDYVRFMAQYGRNHIVGGPRAATVDADSVRPINDRRYNDDTFAVRAQLEF